MQSIADVVGMGARDRMCNPGDAILAIREGTAVSRIPALFLPDGFLPDTISPGWFSPGYHLAPGYQLRGVSRIQFFYRIPSRIATYISPGRSYGRVRY